MKFATWNVNGIRSVEKKGFHDWFTQTDADVVCLQETKASADQLGFELRAPKGYHSVWHSAVKRGYSGVATLSRNPPDEVIEGLKLAEFDTEGRVLTTVYGDVALVNAYFPNSQREGQRLPYKLKFCDAMLKHLEVLRAKGKHVILCGDYNIAHQEIDLRNPKSNTKNAGFLPEERAWMTRFLSQGFIDIFRRFEPGGGHYTWWSYRPGVREKNVGWRIDYHCVNEAFEKRVKSSSHQPAVLGSDHCPVLLETWEP